MFGFGKSSSQPRSLQSFGIAGLLRKECRVYYQTIFSTQHLGRVTDLMAACLLKEGIDELKLRALLLFGAFEAFDAQLSEGWIARPADRRFIEPLMIECGVDSDKVAIGMGFNLSNEISLNTEGLSERLAEGKPEGNLEFLLFQLEQSSDRVYLRFQHNQRRVEVASLFALPGKKIDRPSEEKGKTQVVIFDQPEGDTPEAAAYIELGDLDYEGLLSDDEFHQKKLAAQLKMADSEESTESESAVKVSEVTQKVDNENIKIKGSTELETLKYQNKLYQSQIEELHKKIAVLEKKRLQRYHPVVVREEENQPVFKRLFNLFVSFVRRRKVIDLEETALAPIEKVESGTSPYPLMESLDMTVFDKVIKRIQLESKEIKELNTGRARLWADGLLNELLAEKEHLKDLARKFNFSIRQKEAEFRSKELQLQEELKKRDAMLRQKDVEALRLKDHLMQMNLTLERRKGTGISVEKEILSKQKMSHVQRLLTTTKEENLALMKKIEELRNSLNKAEYLLKSRDVGIDPNEVKKRLEAAMKLVTSQKQESEKMRVRLNELQQEETRLKMELSRAYDEIKSIKKNEGSDPSQAA